MRCRSLPNNPRHCIAQSGRSVRCPHARCRGQRLQPSLRAALHILLGRSQPTVRCSRPPLQSSALHGAEQPMWAMPTRPTPQTEAESSSANSAAEPAQQELASSALPPTPTAERRRWGDAHTPGTAARA